MKKCMAIVCLGFLFSTGGLAQSSWKFRSAESLGMLWGQAGQFGQVATVNGAAKGPWFLGVGVGLDYYRFRSLPVFLSVTKDLMPAKNGLFMTVDGGVNYPLYHRPEGYYDLSFATSEFEQGPYWSAGLGYKIRLSPQSDQCFSLSGGYSFKDLKENADAYNGPVRYDYRNRQWFLKIGLVL